MAKLPPYRPSFYAALLCLSASLRVYSTLTPSHSSSLSSYDSAHVEQSPGADEASQHIGYRHVAYYVDVPADKLTHLLYAFANVHPETGETFLTDTWADTGMQFSTDSTTEIGTNLFGCLKQIYLLKKRNRNLKVLLSIGGGSSNTAFAASASTPEGRRKFAQSAVAMLKDLPFDGLDVDWEYPETPQQGCDLAELLAVTRNELDDYAASLPSKPRFLLTIASPAGPQNFPNFPFREIDSHLDFWNLMAYDYAGSWDKVAAHQANVFPSESTPKGTPFSTDDAISHYIRQGISASKIVVGMPLYGRAFQNTTGPGTSFSGIGNGSFPGQDGVWSYKDLPKPGAQVFLDPQAVASWSYDDASHTMISYDTPQVVGQKVEYIKARHLGGAMWWETSGDQPSSSNNSLINSAAERLGGYGNNDMEKSENCLDYPQSKYDNLRRGMPDE